MMNATDWAVSTQGANVINMSWGAADPAPPYMASAINNISGESRLSERDGAGGIDLHMADEVLANNWYTSPHLTPASFDVNDNYDMTMPIQAGERVW